MSILNKVHGVDRLFIQPQRTVAGRVFMANNFSHALRKKFMKTTKREKKEMIRKKNNTGGNHMFPQPFVRHTVVVRANGATCLVPTLNPFNIPQMRAERCMTRVLEFAEPRVREEMEKSRMSEEERDSTRKNFLSDLGRMK